MCVPASGLTVDSGEKVLVQDALHLPFMGTPCPPVHLAANVLPVPILAAVTVRL